jgi:Carboxypeptidase regulatory-like domain
MKRTAALVLLLLCACSLRAPRNNASTCNSDQQCGGSNVCFLGQCRGHSTSLGLVSVEVQPGGGSPFGVLQAAGLNLQQSVVQNFTAKALVTVHGAVTQQEDGGVSDPVPDAAVTFTSQTPVIADRVQQTSVQADPSGGFTLKIAQDLFDVTVRPPAPDPPFRTSQPFSTLNTATAGFSASLPAESSLVKVQGVIDAGGESLAGASITAADAAGDPISSPVQVGAGNSFALSLPPATSTYFLEVGPPAAVSGPGGIGPSPGIAALPNFDQLPGTDDVVLPLPQVATLSGTAVDGSGKPLSNVTVYARSSSDEPFTLSRSVTTDSSGAFSLVLRAGNYLVEAAPLTNIDQPAVSPAQQVTVAASGSTGLQLVCPAKVSNSALVLLPGGATRAAGPGFQVTATLISDQLISARQALTTATDANGLFQITGDPGTYRIEIAPPASVGVPRHITQIDLEGDPDARLPVIQMDAALTVVGTVHGTPAGGTDGPLPGATVTFFALDAKGLSVLLGSALTDQNGTYSVILPDIANP